MRLEFGSIWYESGIECLEINIFAGIFHWIRRQIDFGELMVMQKITYNLTGKKLSRFYFSFEEIEYFKNILDYCRLFKNYKLVEACYEILKNTK